MPELFIISDSWNKLPWYSTGGTREKMYLQSPDGDFYYFKRSQLKPGKDYRYEFWGEVIAYEIGVLLGFEVLRYDIAIYKDVMGCISKSIIDSEESELIEGVKYLQSFAPNYNPRIKEHQNRYTFDLIKNSLEKAGLKAFMPRIVETIVFDSLIGNGDRHQENWAFINRLRPMLEIIDELDSTGELNKFNRFIKWILAWLRKEMKKSKEKGERLPKILHVPEVRFAPIYDSGSSLGRELLNERVDVLLNSEEELRRYVNNGKAEIHWGNKKLTHFELLRELLQSEYRASVKESITRILERWNGPGIEKIIHEVDHLVPGSHNSYKIPDNRKRLIVKILTLRLQRLEITLHEGI